MEKVIEKTENLIEEILRSDEYVTLKSINKKIEANSELKIKLDAFNAASYKLEMKRFKGEEITFDEEKLVSAYYSDVYMNEDGRIFLETERSLYNTIQVIYGMIADRIIIP